MKKIFLMITLTAIVIFFSAPFFVQARSEVGYAYIDGNIYTGVVTLYCDYTPVTKVDFADNILYGYVNGYRYSLPYIYSNSLWNITQSSNELKALYIPTLTEPFTWSVDGETRSAFTTLDDFEDFLNPPPSNIWEYFYDWFEDTFGHRPVAGTIYDFLKDLFVGEHENIIPDITFPTLTPTPTPTPYPTPIPVQTIFVPDGNGNTTIIYQYPDPTTGVITQSPYNPNIENNITVNCDCDGGGSGGSDNTFKPVSNDPYSMDASLFWADGFGVQMSDNPLSSTDDNQKTLKAAAEEYTSSVEVLSNSFNIIPFKWLELIGLCGGILIIAGLIKTFLGG